MIGRISTFIDGAIIAGVIVAGIIAYLVFSYDPETQQWFDGFGRPLSASPWFMRVLFGEERLWAGWSWFMVDMVIFWGGIAIAMDIAGLGKKTVST